jgi:iron complex transport system permease protein
MSTAESSLQTITTLESVQSARSSLRLRWAILSGALLLSLAIIFCLNVTVGSVGISFDRLTQILAGGAAGSSEDFIVWHLRIPRAIGSALGGGLLAVSGLLLQIYFRNPIVGPYVLGISSGATLMVATVMLSTLHLGFTTPGPYLSTIAAFIGAYAMTLVILGIASKVRSAVTLLVTGLMVGYLCHALTSILMAFAEKEKIKGFILWEMGSFAGLRWSEVQVLAVVGATILALTLLLAKPLNAFLLGEEYAATMGVNVRLFRVLILFSSSSLAGMTTAFAGPVAFIGLATPHIARLCFGTSDSRVLIPGAILMGAVVTSLCDFVARLVFSPVELPLSAITAFFGAPIVVGLLLKKGASL